MIRDSEVDPVEIHREKTLRFEFFFLQKFNFKITTIFFTHLQKFSAKTIDVHPLRVSYMSE